MVDSQATTDVKTPLTEKAIQKLKASFRGELLRPGDGEYDQARKVWNGMIDRRPALIARCSGVADVISALDFARTNKLPIAVRGGGHNVAGYAVCDGGIVIDQSRRKGVRVDLARRTARAEAGATWGDFDRETQAFGLATTGGLISTTGIAGLTLGGGLGWLMRKYGLACDNLLSADVVTSDGRLVTASAAENADLFWGLRGGGGNFGIVTSFEYSLHALGQLMAGVVFHPLAGAKDMLKFYRDFTSTAPDEVFSLSYMFNSPDGDPVIGFMIGYAGPVKEGERVLAPFRKLGHPLSDEVRVAPYVELQRRFDDVNPIGLQVYYKSNFLSSLSDDAINVMVARGRSLPVAPSHPFIEHLGGAVSRVGQSETAFAQRSAGYNFTILSMWPDVADNQRYIRWTRDFSEEMQQFSATGVYVNYLGVEGEDRVKAAYGPEKYARLVQLKNKYDPTNIFRLNQNIKPTA